MPATTALVAGPVRCVLDGGNLRYVEVGGREAIRAVAFIVRDRNWRTYTPAISDLRIEQRGGGFKVTYEATCGDGRQELRYRVRIEGDATGKVTFEAEGLPLTDFVTNRTGFVVLHPIAGVAGGPVTVEHVDGRRVRSRFPERIEPDCPFRDIRALTHEVAPGVSVTCRMEGDAFEMEDHRNWMDASYKTYVRPLALPWPYTLEAGRAFDQSVTLTLEGRVVATAGAGGPVRVRVEGPAGHAMPPVGLALDPDHADLAAGAVELLRAAGPAHLVAHHDPRRGHGAATLAAAAAVAAEIGADLVVEAVLPCLDGDGRPSADGGILEADVAALARAVAEAGVEPTCLIVSPACDLKSTPPGSVWPPAPSWEAIAAAVRRAFPQVRLGGGMLKYFTELNRKRPPAGLFDVIGHSTCPLVHAGDDISVMENLEALPAIFASARAILGEAPYWLYPTSLAMRANPYGAAPAENPDNIRQAMNRVDPRERGLLGAAWYAGYLAHAARAGLAAVTLAAAAGPSGIVHARQGHAQPWLDAAGAAVVPSWHVLAQHMAARGRPVLESRSSAPRDVQVLALGGPRTSLWLANLTGREQEVMPDGVPGGDARLWVLDEAGFEPACLEPLGFAGRSAAIGRDAAVRLAPYAVARLDVG